jgi:hypothetical protein
MTPVDHQSSDHKASCHCGAIQLILPALPTILNECRCSLCFKYGALWAYYPRDKVIFEQGSSSSQASSYVWGDGQVEFQHCSKCGCVTHWLDLDTSDSSAKMGVNCRMLSMETTVAIPWKVTTGPEWDHLFY